MLGQCAAYRFVRLAGCLTEGGFCRKKVEGFEWLDLPVSILSDKCKGSEICDKYLAISLAVSQDLFGTDYATEFLVCRFGLDNAACRKSAEIQIFDRGLPQLVMGEKSCVWNSRPAVLNMHDAFYFGIKMATDFIEQCRQGWVV
jgi:hypothetical protein